MDNVVILDCGSQFTQLIARRIRELKVHSEVLPWDAPMERIRGASPCAVVVSGDTGPLHLARAVGTPAVGLFGPVPASRNGVRGPAWDNLQAPSRPWVQIGRAHV